LRDFVGNEPSQFDVQRITIGMIPGNLELLAQHVNNLLFTDNSQACEELTKLQAGFFLIDQGLFQTLFIN
jgi:hypothetical protein